MEPRPGARNGESAINQGDVFQQVSSEPTDMDLVRVDDHLRLQAEGGRGPSASIYEVKLGSTIEPASRREEWE